MKRILVILMSLALLFFTACVRTDPVDDSSIASSPEEAKPWLGKTLRVNFAATGANGKQMAWLQKNRASFEAATGATIELHCYNFSALNVKQKADLIGGASADIIYITGSSILEYVDSGFLIPLDRYFDEQTTADWSFYDNVAVDGKHYVAPHIGGLAYRLVAMNTDLCVELGLEVPPKDGLTWDVMVDYAKKAVEAGYKGYVAPFSGDENCLIHNYYSFAHQAGGSFISEEMTFDFSDPACLAAFAYIDRIFNEDKIIDTITYDAAAALNTFSEGNTLFATMNMSGFQNRYTAGWDFEAAAYNLRDARCGTFNTVDSMAIASTCKEPELAAMFIKWALSTEVYRDYRDNCGSTMNCVASVNTPATLVAPLQHIAEDSDCIYFPPFMDPNGTEIIEQLTIQQKLVALNEVTPEEAVKTMQALVESLK